MGQMKRAEERERLLRQKLSETHSVVLKWRTENNAYLLDVLDPHSRRPLTRQRVLHDPATILDMVDRTFMPPHARGPKGIILRKNLQAGAGEIEVQITGAQLARLRTDNARH